MTSSTNESVSLDTIAVLVFLCGATASINLELIGQIYLAELLLIPLTVIVLFWKGDNGVLRTRSFWMFASAGLLTLCGYIITDLAVGTQASQYLRGWGRVGLLVTNVVAMMILAGQGRKYIWWFVLGMGIGGVAYLASTGLPFSSWKLGYATRVSFVVLALSCILPRRLGLLLLLLFGILNLGLDYRNLAAVYIIVAGLLWMRSGSATYKVSGFRNYLLLGVAGGMALLILVVGLSLTKEEFSDRREESNIGRMSGIIVSVRAILASPIIGYGSWTENEKYARMLQQEQARMREPGTQKRWIHTKVFRAHSQILQPWVEAGVLGAIFFLYYGYRLLLGARSYILTEPISRFTALNLYFVILGVWHLIASPFGGDQRILIAVTVSILSAIEFERKRSTLESTKYSPPEKNVDVKREESASGAGLPILRRRRKNQVQNDKA